MVYQLPSGKVFLFVSNRTVLIDPATESISSPVEEISAVDGGNRFPYIYPYTPNMVMLPLSKKNDYRAELLLCGGSYRGENQQPVTSAQCYRVAPDSGTRVPWTREPDMPVGRVMLDSVILPGKLNLLNTYARCLPIKSYL
jgi:hypothetical protein